MSVPSGQPVRLTFKTYSDADKTTLADPTALTLYVKTADGTITPYTWASAAVTRDSLGVFHYDLSGTGLVQYRWVATGAVATSSRAGAVNFEDAFPAALVGLDDVKDDTNITASTDDDELQKFIYTASALLLNHPDYRIADLIPATYTQDWTDCGDTIILDHYPATITSVTEYVGGVGTALAAEPINTATFTSYGYRLTSAGILTRLSGGYPARFLGPVRIVYATTGSIPWDVRGAVLVLIEHLWETQRGGSGPGLQPGLEIDDTLGTFGGPLPYALPNRVKEMLAAYRRGPVFA